MKLHGYQERAVRHLHANPRAALLLDLGLGKSATTLSALTPEHLPALVIAPKRVAENVWEAERDLWRPDLSLTVAAGTPAVRRAALAAHSDITVIGRDNIGDVEPGTYRTIVLDELSGFKSRASVRWKRAAKLCKAATYVWGLTGTPTPNGLMDLWAQMALIDGGQRLERTLTAFRNRYFDPGKRLPTGTIVEWILKPGAAERIQGAISDICLSMQAADYLDLPPVTHNRIAVTLPSEAAKVYADLERDLVASLDVMGTEVSAMSAGVLTGKLSQVTAGAIYHDPPANTEWSELHLAKVEALLEVIEGTGSPVLVFYRFRHELAMIRKALPQARRIDEPGIIAEWNAGEVPVLLAHPASAGHGLNLQRGGHTMVWTSLDWSLELWQQAIGRLARQGQTAPVTVHRLEVAGSLDEVIWGRLANKTSVQDSLLKFLAATA